MMSYNDIVYDIEYDIVYQYRVQIDDIVIDIISYILILNLDKTSFYMAVAGPDAV